MTISSSTASASYTGNGTTTAFTIPFYFLVDTDVKISKKAGATGAITVLTLNSDYTLIGAGNQAGGTATLTVAPVGGTTPDQLFIERNVDAVQETAYPANSPFPAASHEKALDRLTMLVQQLLSKLTFGLFRNPLAATYDLGGNTLSNIANAVNAQDVPSLVQVQGLIVAGAAPALSGPNGAALIGFQQSGTGSAARTLDARGKEAVSITDFAGVDPTGTTDSTAGIQAALNAHAGKIIRAPAGVYLFASTLLIPSNTRLVGDGKGRTIFRATAALSLSTPIVKNTNQTTPGAVNGFVDSNIRVEGITFDGGSYAGRTIALGYFWKVNGIEFERCEFENSTYMGLAVIACEAPRIIDNYLHDCGNPVATSEGGAAIYVAGTTYDGSISQNAEISLNRFANNRWSHMSLGLTKGSVSFNSCITGGESGIFATGCTQVNFVGNTIDGQTKVDIAASGIELDNSNHCLISQNTVKNCGADGISASDCQFVTIANNNCLNNGQQHASVTAFAHASGIGIAGTQASPNGPNHINIRGNTCADNQVTQTQQHGVQLIVTGSSPAISNLIIDGNDFTGCAVSDINAPAGSIGSDGYIANNTTRTAQRQSPIAVMVVQAPASTGNAAITGVGFRPRAVQVSFSLAGAGTVIHGTGVFDGTSQCCDFIYQDATGRASGPLNGYFVNASDSASNVVTRGSVSSLDVDGCTINWTSVASRCWMVLRFYR